MNKPIIKNKKYCLQCKKMKLVDLFYKRSGYQKKYYQAYCKECMKKRSISWAKDNKEKFNTYQKQYQKTYYRRKREIINAPRSN